MADRRQRIGIDLTALTPQHTGIDRFLMNLVAHLALTPGSFRCHVFVNREDLPLFRGRLPDHFHLHALCFRPRAARLFFQQIVLPMAALLLRLDTLHSPSFIMPLFPLRARNVLTIHDLTTLTMPEVHIPMRRSRLFSFAMKQSMRRAQIIHVPSQFVKDDIERLVDGVDPTRIRVIPHGIGDHFNPAAAQRGPEVAKGLGVTAPFILYLGNIDPRKNLEFLLNCYAKLVANEEIDEHLVIAGPLGWKYDEVLRLSRAPEVADRIHLTGYVPEADLPALMAAARLFVYPSHQEGFGFPPLEAMACGVPVIVSRSSSLSENLEGAASCVPSDDEAALQAEIKLLLSDSALRAERREQGLLRAAQFSWERCATQMLSAYGYVEDAPAGVDAVGGEPHRAVGGAR